MVSGSTTDGLSAVAFRTRAVTIFFSLFVNTVLDLSALNSAVLKLFAYDIVLYKPVLHE